LNIFSRREANRAEISADVRVAPRPESHISPLEVIMKSLLPTPFVSARRIMGAAGLLVLGAFLLSPAFLAGGPNAGADDPPALEDLIVPPGIMPGIIERYEVESGDSPSGYLSPKDVAGMKSANDGWLKTLTRLDFDKMSQEDKVDYLLFRHRLDLEGRRLEAQVRTAEETAAFVPFAGTIADLEQARRRMDPMDPQKIAGEVDALARRIAAVQREVEAKWKSGGPGAPAKSAGSAAGEAVRGLREILTTWFGFFNGYDPMFTWWVDAPWKDADAALKNYATFLYEKIAGVPAPPEETGEAAQLRRMFGGRAAGRGMRMMRSRGAADAVVPPIGREALAEALEKELIPYTPEQVLAIGESEYAWCEAEMKKASREMGFGDDWHKALERVKTLHAEPGGQPKVVHDLSVEAIKYLDDHDLITLPEAVRRGWDMNMMSPERQLVNPFFTGGQSISISFPTNTMSHERKLMSMRGNNIHFARATVFHELIPGHYFQGWMSQRYRPYRRPFGTAFYSEGWALYWEMTLYEMGFPKSPENRIGMLFWRMHRAARIIFSLSYHLGRMTLEECIDMLVNKVGHERENAAGEVRRSFNGSYDPLYQAAYMLGGLQLRALRKELVDSGKMTNRAFHDRILRENAMPIVMLRALMTDQKLGRDFRPEWNFYGPNPGGK
jgi:uncharacterized protein (DUF885 family)